MGSPTGGPGGNLTNTLEGRFSATTLNATLTTQGPNVMAPGGGEMRISLSLRGRRLGDPGAGCPARGALTGGPGGAANQARRSPGDEEWTK